MRIAAGIDVGGPRKGFHAVALGDGTYFDKFRSTDAAEMAAWIRGTRACAVAVDAPCHWRKDGDMRPAERGLAHLHIRCFATPSRAAAEVHPFYAWMRNGMSLYRRLSADYPLLDNPAPPGRKVCIETFPQAITCVLAGRGLSARNKRLDRRERLEASGVDTGALDSLDFIDAALCALAAHRFLLRKFRLLGDPGEGYLLLPA